MANPDDIFGFCQAELKKTDPIRHFVALTTPELHRPYIFALYAFLAEIDRIPKMVTEQTMGEIRLQWWKDTVTRDADGTSGCGGANIGPLATALKDVIRRYNLPTQAIEQMIEARIFDLYNDPMPDMTAYETYAGETQALPLLLAAQILNDGESC